MQAMKENRSKGVSDAISPTTRRKLAYLKEAAS